MLKTKGLQTIRYDLKSDEEILNDGPIKSLNTDEYGNEIHNKPFCGEGYYFWDNNIEAARWWGKIKYTNRRKRFLILSIDLELNYTDNYFFDLVGNMEHLLKLREYVESINQEYEGELSNWNLNNYIELLKKLNTHNPNYFPYKIIRFFENKNKQIKSENRIFLRRSGKQQNIMDIHPFYIYCVLDLNFINLGTLKIIEKH